MPVQAQRTRSGTIPSMETSNEALQDNTVIVGVYPCPHRYRGRPLIRNPASLWCFWRLGPKEGWPSHTTPDTDLIVFQTFPALFGLYRSGHLPKDVHIVGYARTKMEPETYLNRVTTYIKNPNGDPAIESELKEFKKLLTYVSGGYDSAEPFINLTKHLHDIEKAYTTPKVNRLFYLALPPSVFLPVAKNVKDNCYSANGINRIIVEKPFGRDLDSCRRLLEGLKLSWKEDETYRIDHYLGKEMVKNLLVLRFANVAMNAAWDRNSISNVQITFKEPFGTEGRGGYFDEFGIIRDILQNREYLWGK